LLYLLDADKAKADRAEATVAAGGVISVQVLNEFVAVAIRKLKMAWPEITAVVEAVQAYCVVEPLTVAAHQRGCWLAERYGFSVYDAMIVASALLAGCATLYTEDMQEGMLVDGQLTIRNPFV
jgi:predicted nucleic acid-binding protein